MSSSLFLIAAKWTQYLIGLFSIVVLARLLEPAAFGIVAMSSIVLKLFEVLTNTGTPQYLMSRGQIENFELSTAWTLNLLSKFVVSISIVLSASYIARWFSEPKLVNVLYVSAIIPVLDGLQNTGQFLLRRGYQYQRIFYSLVLTKLLSFLVTVSVAVIYKSYWALVVGNIAYSLSFLILTYKIHPFRPRVTLLGFREQWDFSKWLLMRGGIGYLRSKADQIIVSSFFTARELGIYTMSKDIAVMPNETLSQPLMEIFLTSVRESKNDLSRAADILGKIMVVLVSVMLPASLGIYLVSENLVLVMLGQKWIGAIPILQALAFLSLTFAASGALAATLTGMGRVRMVFLMDLVSFSVVIPILYFFRGSSLEEFAMVRVILGAVIFAFFLISARYYLPLNLLRLGVGIFPAIAASFSMVFSLVNLSPLTADLHPAVTLGLQILVGGCIYTLVFGILVFVLSSKSNELRFIRTNVTEKYRFYIRGQEVK